MTKIVKIIITGIAQGVFFRVFVKKHTDKLGIECFTRNLSDSSIEIIAQGESMILDELLERVKIDPDFALQRLIRLLFHVKHLVKSSFVPSLDLEAYNLKMFQLKHF